MSYYSLKIAYKNEFFLYAALPLHMQRGWFRIRTHDQQVTKAQLYHCTRARPHYIEMNIDVKFIIIFYIIY